MLGDWVLCDGEPYQIAEISAGLLCIDAERELFANPEDLEPIPLTGEILEKNGLICHSGLWVVPEAKRLDLGLFYIGIDDGCGVGICVMPEGKMTYFCNSVHQLQHVLRLCGTEKEIVL